MMVGLGLIIGIVTASVCSRFIESLLYEVRGDDPVNLGVVVLLCIAGLIACLLPARRAAKVDPIAALRPLKCLHRRRDSPVTFQII
jgi:ABC-type antimicrobial peptide transport system permease subunit